MRRKLHQWYLGRRYWYGAYLTDLHYTNLTSKVKELPMPFFLWMVEDYVRQAWWWAMVQIICRYFGKHKWTSEDWGDVENGPIIETYCRRCGLGAGNHHYHL